MWNVYFSGSLFFSVSIDLFSSSVILIPFYFFFLYYLENTKDGWDKRWVPSEWKKDENLAGEWNYTSGKWNGDPNDKGIRL